jgi:hypothetical protein
MPPKFEVDTDIFNIYKKEFDLVALKTIKMILKKVDIPDEYSTYSQFENYIINQVFNKNN